MNNIKKQQNTIQPVILSIVVPVYRSANTLEKLYNRVQSALQHIDPNFELIFVEDCGGDQSWQVIQSLAQIDSRVKGIKLSRNFGQHAATICGISESQGDWIVTIDDDLEHPPKRIPDLYKKALEGYDITYGIYPKRTHAFWRNITSSIGRWLFKKAIPSLNDEYTSFRCIKRDVAMILKRFDSPFPFVDGYLSWITNNYAVVEVKHSNRDSGTSNYNFTKLIAHTLNIFVTFSDIPLKIASHLGILFSFVGITWMAWLIIGKYSGWITVSGFTSIMSATILFGGIQLLILGILGEYLGRISFRISKKPLYLIGGKTDKKPHG